MNRLQPSTETLFLGAQVVLELVHRMGLSALT
jgi:hypothetical protein